jgi:hypothetical protein
VQAGNKRTMRWWAPAQPGHEPTKYWPDERWATVIATMLREDSTARVVLLGVPAELKLNAGIARLVKSERVVKAADALPIQRLLALQAHAQGMVSVDHGSGAQRRGGRLPTRGCCSARPSTTRYARGHGPVASRCSQTGPGQTACSGSHRRRSSAPGGRSCASTTPSARDAKFSRVSRASPAKPDD